MIAMETNDASVFVYMGEGGESVPENVVHVRVHPTVTSIPHHAFAEKSKLETVELCEGLQEIGRFAFNNCKALKNIIIPPSVTAIHMMAFMYCIALTNVELNEGLQEIGDYCFYQCLSLEKFDIPTTVKIIGNNALGKTNMQFLHIPDGIENIGDGALNNCSFTNFRIPPLIAKVSKGMFGNCGSMFSLETSKEKDIRIEGFAFRACHTLRNVAFLPNTEIEVGTFHNCTDLRHVFTTEEAIANSLRHRFDNLLVHEICYYQTHYSRQSILEKIDHATTKLKTSTFQAFRRNKQQSSSKELDPTGREQDCLGMTPLHILACSSVHHLEIYQLIIMRYPVNLIIEDEWGAIPLLYAIWGNAPREIIYYLIERHQSLYPQYRFNWDEMVATLGRANAPLATIQNLLNVQQHCFPGQVLDWDQIIRWLAAPVERLNGSKPHPSPGTFCALTKISIANRVSAIGVKQWRVYITKFCDWTIFLASETSIFNRNRWLEEVKSKVTHYEAEYQKIKEATAMLELVLWKAKLHDESSPSQANRIDELEFRVQCRISCGAQHVIESVLPYLTSLHPNEKKLADKVIS